jgi:hypothetical protein
MFEHTPLPHPLAPAPSPHTPEPHQRPRALGTYLLSGLEQLVLVTSKKPLAAVPTLRDATADRKNPDENLNQQRLIKLVGGD